MQSGSALNLFSKVPPREAEVWKTPMFEQYWRIRETLPTSTILFYRMGDFYEIFGEDAVRAAPLLEVQLTARNKDAEIPVPMCGVPVHAIDSYSEKLLGAGVKVALCEQLSDPATTPKAKLVERGVIRILTPGLPVDYNRISSKEPHWFVSLALTKQNARVCVLDFLGSQLFEGSLASPPELEDLLKRLEPKEILVPSDVLGDPSLSQTWTQLSDMSEWASRFTPWAGRDARVNLEEYLLYTQRCARESLAGLLPEAKPLQLIAGRKDSELAQLPASVLNQWAVFPELFDLLDGAGSAVGSRRLRQILSMPLRHVGRLRNRQAFVRLMLGDADRLESFLRESREVYDVERLLGRFRIGVAAPRELQRLRLSLEAIERALDLSPLKDPAWVELGSQEGIKPHSDLEGSLARLKAHLKSALKADLDINRLQNLCDLVQEGYDPELDRLRGLHQNAEQWLLDFETKLKESTGIQSLKIRYNRVFGYYIEVTKAHLSKVPSFFERKQTTVNGERFTCQELREKEHEILTAGVRAEARAKDLLEKLQREVLEMDSSLREYIGLFSWMDALYGVARSVRKLSRFGSWSFPELEEGDFHFVLREARHPIIESMSGGSFVPNSIELGHGKSLLLLTGPNMAGKSTLMRQTGLCLLLAQCGFPVSAAGMRLAPCSGFFSRMGASDKIFEGESTFMVEMKETAALLREADANSFVLIDEIGRGTSTEDGLAIAQAVLEHLHDEVGCVAIFATHYHELSNAAEQLPHAVNGSMGIQEWKGELVFLRTLKLEPAESSYGIYVAKMAGLPKKVLKRAQDVFLKTLESSEPRRGPGPQLDFFASLPSSPESEENTCSPESKIVQELRKIQLDEVSPRQAWLILESLVNVYGAPKSPSAES